MRRPTRRSSPPATTPPAATRCSSASSCASWTRARRRPTPRLPAPCRGWARARGARRVAPDRLPAGRRGSADASGGGARRLAPRSTSPRGSPRSTPGPRSRPPPALAAADVLTDDVLLSFCHPVVREAVAGANAGGRLGVRPRPGGPAAERAPRRAGGGRGPSAGGRAGRGGVGRRALARGGSRGARAGLWRSWPAPTSPGRSRSRRRRSARAAVLTRAGLGASWRRGAGGRAAARRGHRAGRRSERARALWRSSSPTGSSPCSGERRRLPIVAPRPRRPRGRATASSGSCSRACWRRARGWTRASGAMRSSACVGARRGWRVKRRPSATCWQCVAAMTPDDDGGGATHGRRS